MRTKKKPLLTVYAMCLEMYCFQTFLIISTPMILITNNIQHNTQQPVTNNFQSTITIQHPANNKQQTNNNQQTTHNILELHTI